jgi:hypothetical protein
MVLENTVVFLVKEIQYGFLVIGEDSFHEVGIGYVLVFNHSRFTNSALIPSSPPPGPCCGNLTMTSIDTKKAWSPH